MTLPAALEWKLEVETASLHRSFKERRKLGGKSWGGVNLSKPKGLVTRLRDSAPAPPALRLEVKIPQKIFRKTVTSSSPFPLMMFLDEGKQGRLAMQLLSGVPCAALDERSDRLGIGALEC